ncbi:MAG: hypothetical protein VKK04_00385 [Synechococcales bacterium]|nr:hypothetical protein [Synechococcales bacterium]
MSTYEEVLSLAQTLRPSEQNRLLVALAELVYRPVEVEDSDETISAEELAESDLAIQAYRSGKDPGLSSTALKHKLFATIGPRGDVYK